MKVIVSHDVDHITFWEHRKDLIIPKFFVRNAIECATGNISFSEMMRRFGPVCSNRWHRLPELIAFDLAEKIPSTFFFGMNNGCNLNYSLRNASFWIQYAADHGFDVGVHGIGYHNSEEIRKEFSSFKTISGKTGFGIRMHYLRQTIDTLKYLSEAGYSFDSTVRTPLSPYKIGEMWEFPLHIMDGDIMQHGKPYGNKSLKQAQLLTKSVIDQVFENQSPYLTVLFHDLYFDHSFSVWYDWYHWIIEYLKSSGFEFTGYHQALKDLDDKR